MEYLFTVFAIVWIVFNLPIPPPTTSAGLAKLIIGLVGIILLIIFLFGIPHAVRVG